MKNPIRLVDAVFSEDDLVKVEGPPLGEALTCVLAHAYRRRGNRGDLEALRLAVGEIVAVLEQEIADTGYAN